MKVITVSGVPATGKTTFSTRLCRHFNLYYLDVNQLIEKEGLCVGYDKKRDCRIIDEKKLVKILIDNIKKLSEDNYLGIVVDSHLSHLLPNSYVDLCVITSVGLKALKARLEKRGYSEKKVRENLDSQIFDICLAEAKDNGHDILVVKGNNHEKYFRKIASLLGF